METCRFGDCDDDVTHARIIAIKFEKAKSINFRSHFFCSKVDL